MNSTSNLSMTLILYCVLSSANARPLTNDLNNIKDFSTKANYNISQHYVDTECINLLKKNSPNNPVGIICKSSDKNLSNDLGIHINNTQQEKAVIEVSIGTAMSIYKMDEKSLDGIVFYSADIDCDAENGAIYRATSTCQIIYMDNKNYFFYANLLLYSHTRKTDIITSNEMQKILHILIKEENMK